jgi:glycosyltransferase involved in cell wall biosynthesis
MEKTPEISVIMPNFNKSKYVGDAIESVLSQTFSNFELIVVDAASTDGSRRVVEVYLAKDSRVSLVSRPTLEFLSCPRNIGIKCSRADVIAFLDSDDI